MAKLRIIRQEETKKTLIGWAAMREISYVEIQPWHIRLTNDGDVLDIFPQRQTYHNVTDNVRGYYKDLTKFLSDHFQID